MNADFIEIIQITTEREARSTDREVVEGVRELLGAKLTAYLAGLTTTRRVSEWANGEREIDADACERLRCAYLVAGSLVGGGTPQSVVQVWFQGMNPWLADQAPARVIRELRPGEGMPKWLDSAMRALMVGSGPDGS